MQNFSFMQLNQKQIQTSDLEIMRNGRFSKQRPNLEDFLSGITLNVN